MEQPPASGRPVPLNCPECGGTLSELPVSRPPRYRCHTGHAFTATGLVSAQARRNDAALQSSLRVLQVREQLLRRVAAVSRNIGEEAQAQAGLRQAAKVREQARRLAGLLEKETGGA